VSLLRPSVPDKTENTKQIPPQWRERLKAWLNKVVTPRRMKIAGLSIGIPLGALLAVGVAFYFIESHRIDRQPEAGMFADSVNVYASPLYLAVGDMLTEADLTAELNIAGYRESTADKPLTWRAQNGRVEIFPEDGSAPAHISLANNQIAQLQSGGKDVKEIYLASPLITTLSAKKEERLPAAFRDIPPNLVKAVLAAEDKHFFQHDGLDIPRMLKAAYTDVREGRKEQGASTVTMQLVRGLWLEPGKKWKRKLEEIVMTIHLERAWSKEKIFEAYANQVYLGRQADYSVHGFGEAARMFFGKKLGDISLGQAAMLAGMVQRPSYFNPVRWPERAKERRDRVLEMMRHNGYITAGQYEIAVNEPLGVTSDPLNDVRAPYFLDLVNDELQEKQAAEQENYDEPIRNVYSTIDLNLQHAADEAVAAGMEEVDRSLGKRRSHSGAKAEVALIALDPHTGEIKALVGGRDYRKSQLNRILSRRPPGSVFKPFVYTAALETAISEGANTYTPASMVDDSPATFWFDGKPYAPGNFRGERFGTMTFREALARSDNVAAVKVAQEVGYRQVVSMARRFGLNDGIRATPAVALGTYQVTPFEIARAYTVFANGGMLVNPVVVSSYRNDNGAGLGTDAHSAQAVRVLDPRINWLMVNMLEEVMRSGTAAGVRALGFVLPAAGKTGTSHDGWFAGFTSQLLCVVWVGFDDYTELGLEGAKSALPIWTEFMKRASRIGSYRNAKEFPTPKGITQAQICAESGELATEQCVNTREAYFVSGTEPMVKCHLHANSASDDPDAASASPIQNVVVTSEP
jgi:penicillin-binding protein 1B